MPDKKRPEAGLRSGAAPSVPSDRAARERIRADLDTTFLVEAGAGSGKTRSLVDRMVALIAGGRATVQTMAAVTFTRKAAAELRGRFQLALERSLAPGETSPDEESAVRLRAALLDLEQCFIGTIHSFCARLLRERPVECGLDPEFEELDELENTVFREECWHDYLALARLEADDVLRRLDDVGLSPEDLRDAFDVLSGYPEVIPASDIARAPDFAALRDRLEAFLDAAAAAVPERRPEAGWDGLQSLMRRLAGRRGRLGFSDPRLLMESLELLDRCPRVVKKCWPAKETAEALEEALRHFREEVVGPALRAWREFRHATAMAFLRPALRFFETARRDRSRLNFQDQLGLAAELLRENPEVRRYFQARYRRVLVDEFQDTDPVQAEVLFYLTGRDACQKDWTRLVPLPGSLFLVGDPKQSIYRFRRADIDIYNLVKDGIRGGGGEVLELTANFRSLAGLTGWVNPIFRVAFPDEATPFQAAYARLEAVRPGRPDGACGVFKVTVPKVERNKGETIARLDADNIARFIAGACAGGLAVGDGGGGARPARPEDFLVLFRYRKFMDIYARALEARRIPCEVSGSSAFSESAEIDALVSLLLAFANPDNPVAAVAVLKGLFFGASDQDLLDFRGSGGEFRFVGGGDRTCNGTRSGDGPVARALRTLGEWWDWTTRYPLSVALEMILESSGLPAYLAGSEMGSLRAGIVIKLIEVVRSFEIGEAATLPDVADFLAAGPGREAVEGMSLTPDRPNAVRLMNLHKAKGLEAPVVVLANPLGQKEHEPDKHIVRTGEGLAESGAGGPGGTAAPLGFFQFRKRGLWKSRLLAEPPGWAEKAEREAKYAEAEEQRLMYVAATRAGDMLVVSTYAADLGGKKSWSILEEGLAGVSELPEAGLPDEARDVKPVRRLRSGRLILSPADHRRGRLQIEARRGRASEARYRVETVTSLAKQDRPFPDRDESGSGLAWGSAVHMMLSVAGRSRLGLARDPTAAPAAEEVLRLLAANACAAAGLAAGDEGRLAALVQEILASEFWARAERAERSLFEVPFSIKVGPDDPDCGRLVERPGLVPTAGGRPVATAAEAPVFLTGAVDLAFLEDGGWVIADYKTDRLADTAAGKGVERARSALDRLVDYYRPQVELYRKFWEKLTAEPVKETGLYFTSIGAWVRLS